MLINELGIDPLEDEQIVNDSEDSVGESVNTSATNFTVKNLNFTTVIKRCANYSKLRLLEILDKFVAELI